MKRVLYLGLSFLLLAVAGLLRAADDLPFADFEGESYAPWTAKGEAFGTGPAVGTLPGQMAVSGFEGKRLVNSFCGGDRTTGKLISPDFKIERKYLCFLIGGGGDSDRVYMSLFVDGKEVLRASGTNISPGGSEALAPYYWDLTEFAGKTGRIEIHDNATGGWGHLNVDALVFSDTPRGESAKCTVPVEKTRELQTAKRFLLFPVSSKAPKTYLRVEVDGEPVRTFTIRLAESPETVDFYGTLEVAAWSGKTLRLVAERVTEDCAGLDLVRESDELADGKTVYKEKYRPQFHFAPRRGWTNDPNGLHWFNGVWHLFYQHNPFSTDWGNMTWGHATSPDLLHWTEGPDALLPDRLGTIFSGSGVVDHQNTSGLAPKGSAVVPQVVFYTSHGAEARPAVPVTQSMAYSLDGGTTWTKYAENPVLPHIIGGNRDPKVFWHQPTQKWVMALYLDKEDYALFGSKNLTDWEELCRIEKLGCSECPDMFELAIDGDQENKKWVFWGGDGNYLLGSFDGRNFSKEAGPFRSKYGGNDYAAQTFSDTPDGRRIQFSWMSGGKYPEMPFNQQFSVPRELTLKTTADGVRLAFRPVKELETLRGGPVADKSSVKIAESGTFRAEGVPELFDAEMTLDVSKAKSVRIAFRGQEILYDVAAGTINGAAPLKPVGGKVTIRLLADRMSWELFAADGVTELAQCFVPSDEALQAAQAGRDTFALSVDGEMTIDALKLYPLESVWPK